MLIYEKDNKLNINFENKVDEPDFSLYKDGENGVVISSNGETSQVGGSGLPAYTDEDEGKILALVEATKTYVIAPIENVSGPSGAALFGGFSTDEDTLQEINAWIDYLASGKSIPDTGSLERIDGISLQTTNGSTYILVRAFYNNEQSYEGCVCCDIQYVCGFLATASGCC